VIVKKRISKDLWVSRKNGKRSSLHNFMLVCTLDPIREIEPCSRYQRENPINAPSVTLCMFLVLIAMMPTG
jgi:hypothetical protein